MSIPGVQIPHWTAAGLEEGRLERVQPAVGGQALDRANVPALDLADRHEAAVDDLAVEQHRARPALALAAALLGPGQAEVQAQDVEQAAPAGDGDLDGPAVHA